MFHLNTYLKDLALVKELMEGSIEGLESEECEENGAIVDPNQPGSRRNVLSKKQVGIEPFRRRTITIIFCNFSYQMYGEREAKKKQPEVQMDCVGKNSENEQMK